MAETTVDTAKPTEKTDTGVDLPTLKVGTVLNVQTRNSLYRVVVLDGKRRLVAVQGGNVFSHEVVTRFHGSSVGGSALKIGWVGVGSCLEFAAGPQLIVTSPVRSIQIETPHAA